jgi:nucleoside phosphorylase
MSEDPLRPPFDLFPVILRDDDPIVRVCPSLAEPYRGARLLVYAIRNLQGSLRHAGPYPTPANLLFAWCFFRAALEHLKPFVSQLEPHLVRLQAQGKVVRIGKLAAGSATRAALELAKHLNEVMHRSGLSAIYEECVTKHSLDPGAKHPGLVAGLAIEWIIGKSFTDEKLQYVGIETLDSELHEHFHGWQASDAPDSLIADADQLLGEVDVAELDVRIDAEFSEVAENERERTIRTTSSKGSAVNGGDAVKRNSAGELFEPQIAIGSIEEYLRLEKLYKDAGKPFNPAVVKGSPAAAHVIAQSQRQQQESGAGDKVDVGIIIALEEEFRELFHQVKDRCQPIADEDSGRSFYRFKHPGSDPMRPYECVATFVGEMGHTKAALVTDSLLRRWAPGTVVLLGIAGGIDQDLSVGDTIAATTVDSYIERAKAAPHRGRKGFQLNFAGEVYRCSPELSTKLQHFEFSNPDVYRRWKESCAAQLAALVADDQRNQLIGAKLLRPTVVVKVGHLASGPIVGATKPFIDRLKQRDRTYLALEMEAGGLMAAVSEKPSIKRTLVLRGISDYADERKEELDTIRDGALRRYAMQNVIHLLWALLESDTIPR